MKIFLALFVLFSILSAKTFTGNLYFVNQNTATQKEINFAIEKADKLTVVINETPFEGEKIFSDILFSGENLVRFKFSKEGLKEVFKLLGYDIPGGSAPYFIFSEELALLNPKIVFEKCFVNLYPCYQYPYNLKRFRNVEYDGYERFASELTQVTVPGMYAILKFSLIGDFVKKAGPYAFEECIPNIYQNDEPSEPGVCPVY